MNSRSYIARYAFTGADQQKKVGMLSGGERNRVHLALMLKEGANVLLLDEPTNDLDVNTLRALEEGILGFAGCVLVISHDRWFLDRVATHILAFEGESSAFWYEGNFSDYEENKRGAAGRRRGGAAPDQVPAPDSVRRSPGGQPMKHRDRVLLSLNHEQPDRCPLQISFTPEFAARMNEVVHIPAASHHNPHGGGNTYELERALDEDLPLTSVGWANSYYANDSYNPGRDSSTDEWGIAWRNSTYTTRFGEGHYTEIAKNPLAEDSAIQGYRPPDPDRPELYSESEWVLRTFRDEYWSSSAGESHPHALTEPDVNLSIHPALIAQPSARGPSASG